MGTAGGFTNNIGSHEKCYCCGKPKHQSTDPSLWPGDTHYCHCTAEEKIAASARGLTRKDIGFSEFKRIVRENSPIVRVVAYSYGCPVHDYGYSSKERRCSCRLDYLLEGDDYNPHNVEYVWKIGSRQTIEDAVTGYKEDL